MPSGAVPVDWFEWRRRLEEFLFSEAETGDHTSEVVFDLSECAQLPSLAFGACVRLARELSQRNRSISLINVNERIQNLMKRMQLLQVLPISH